jgi:hypothetical protein
VIAGSNAGAGVIAGSGAGAGVSAGGPAATGDDGGGSTAGGSASGASSGVTNDASADVANGDAAMGADAAVMHRAGKSAGCGTAPAGATSTTFTNHRISLSACASCTVPNCPKDCVAPPFVPGGRDAQTTANGENFLNRDFTIELPANYDPNQAYPVFYGADGCGPIPPLMGPGFSVPGEDAAIKIGLQQVSLASNGSCFADGGIRCSPDIANVADCVNGPEVPYLLAVMDWVEANFCVDVATEFIGGGSSGAWETLLAGCATAERFRGTYTLAGGLRQHRWPCDGPVASFMMVSDLDMNNPVGPLAKLDVIEDSYGSAPARDEILSRNGCVGKATAPYDPKYPSCVKYTGCPADFPVVWCEFAGGSHDDPNYNGVNYLNAVAPFLTGLAPLP